MIEEGACCDNATDENGDSYAGHVCLSCYYQHCHCPGGTPGPLPMDTKGKWVIKRLMNTPDMSGRGRWATISRPASYQETTELVGKHLFLEEDAVLTVTLHNCKYPGQCCGPCEMHTMPHRSCIMR